MTTILLLGRLLRSVIGASTTIGTILDRKQRDRAVASYAQDLLDIIENVKVLNCFCPTTTIFIYRLVIFGDAVVVFSVFTWLFTPPTEGLSKFMSAIDLLEKVLKGRTWENNAMFPCKGLCDWERLVHNNKHNFIIECFLNYNSLIEKCSCLHGL